MFTRFAAAAALLVAPLAAQATTLVDGSFEMKGAAVTDYCYDGFSAGGNAPCAASAWNGSGVIKSGSAAWGGTTTPAGAYFAFVQGTGGLSQAFTATSSGNLGLTWLDAGRANYGGPQSYVVSLSRVGFAAITILGTYTTGVGQAFTAHRSAPFQVVDGGDYQLVFGGLSNEDRTSFIDNVALTAVPEPATWALMLGGFGLVGFALRRRAATTVAA